MSYNYKKTFSPKRPVKSFLDLEVYQKSLAICVAVVKKVPEYDELHSLVIAIPRLIATAHSLRFSDKDQALTVLDDCMLKCNLAVVYLEQYRDLYNTAAEVATEVDEAGDQSQTGQGKSQKSGSKSALGRSGIGTTFFDEQIKNLLALRTKIMRLQMSWKKFWGEKDER